MATVWDEQNRVEAATVLRVEEDEGESGVGRPSGQAPSPSRLSESELAGLKFIAAKTRMWSLGQLTSYYQGVSAYGTDFDRIAENVVGKTKHEVKIYSYNWARRYPPMEQWLRNFESPNGGSEPDPYAMMEDQADLLVQAEAALTAASDLPRPIVTGMPVRIDPGAILQTPRPRTKTARVVAAVHAGHTAAPCPRKIRTALSATERAGLAVIASKAKAWGGDQLTSYYQALKAFGADFELISKEVDGKTTFECKTYYHNWNRRYAPIDEWLRDFNTPPTLSDQTRMATEVTAATSKATAATAAATIAAPAIDQLSPSEQDGLQAIAKASLSWSVEEIVAFYLAVRTHGQDYGKMHEAVASKTREECGRKYRSFCHQYQSDWVTYMQNFSTKNSSAHHRSGPTRKSQKTSPSEQAGLEYLASQARSWTLGQITSLYLAVRAHGQEYSKLCEAVPGKTREECAKKYRSFSRQYSSDMVAFMRGFSVSKRKRQSTLKPRPSTLQPRPSTVVELSESEQLGLQELAARPNTAWSYDELTTYYSSLQLYGPDFAKITEALAGSKTREQVANYNHKWPQKGKGKSMVAWLRTFKSTEDLTTWEIAGLADIARRANTWSNNQITAYYIAMKANAVKWSKTSILPFQENDADFHAISEAVEGKTPHEVRKYFHNWNRRYGVSMVRWLREFESLQPNNTQPANVNGLILASPRNIALKSPTEQSSSKAKTPPVEPAVMVSARRDSAEAREQTIEKEKLNITNRIDLGAIVVSTPRFRSKPKRFNEDRGLASSVSPSFGEKVKRQPESTPIIGQPKPSLCQAATVSSAVDAFFDGGEAVDINLRPAANKAAAKLSNSERAGLCHLASNSTAWSLVQLTDFYTALKVHGKDYTKLSAAVQGKGREDCAIYYRDWHRRHPPMISHMQNFDALHYPAPRKVPLKVAAVQTPMLSRQSAGHDHWRLSPAERAGLAYHNAKSTAWSLAQLTGFYRAVKAHGKDYAKISAAVPGKSHAEVAIYYRDWHRRHPPMVQYYTTFKLEDATRSERRQIATPTKVPDTVPLQMPSVYHNREVGLISPAKATTTTLAAGFKLSPSERLGLEFLASQDQQWSFKESVAYYQGLRVHGTDFTQIAKNIKDKSTFDVEVRYRTWSLGRPPMEEWLRAFRPPAGFVSQMTPAVMEEDTDGDDDDVDDDDDDDDGGNDGVDGVDEDHEEEEEKDDIDEVEDGYISQSGHGVQNDPNATFRSPSPTSTVGSPVALSAIKLLLQAAEIASKPTGGAKRPAGEGTSFTWNEAELPMGKRPRLSLAPAASGVARQFQAATLGSILPPDDDEEGDEAGGDQAEADAEANVIGAADVEMVLGKVHLAAAAVSADTAPKWRPAKAQSKLMDQNWRVDTGAHCGGAGTAFDLCFKDVKDGVGAVQMYGRSVNVPVEEVRNAIKEERKRGRGAAFYVREDAVASQASGAMVCARLTDCEYPAHGLRFYFNREIQCDFMIESNGRKQYRLLATM